MKKTLFAIFALATSIQVGSAAVQVIGTNFVNTSAGNNKLIVDGTGMPMPGAGLVWAVGIFPTGTDFGGDIVAIMSTFDQNGSAGGFSPNASFPGVFGAVGGLPINDAATSVDGSDPFTPNPVFVVIGNAGSMAASTEFIIAQTPAVWANEIEGVGGSLSFSLMASTVRRGAEIPVAGAAGALAAVNGQVGVTFIPEPSAALLGLLGLAGFIRRRR